MILEAFSTVLHRERRRTGDRAGVILHRWLLGHMTEARPTDMITKVLQTEITLMHFDDEFSFLGTSHTGQVLLDSLYDYCESYEQWQFRRWLHDAKPKTFGTYG